MLNFAKIGIAVVGKVKKYLEMKKRLKCKKANKWKNEGCKKEQKKKDTKHEKRQKK